jgi:uncharacterized membrane protein
MMSLSNAAEYLRSRLWVMPALFLLGVSALWQIAIALDESFDSQEKRWYLFPGGPEGAREVLSTIAASTFTFTGLVFSITIVVLQLAGSQLSPRVMGMFLRDLGTQIVLATFLATFAYSLLVLREVRSDDVVFVPALAIWLAFLLMAIDIILFVYYINHMTQRIRASSVIAEIGRETRKVIEQTYPDPFVEPDMPPPSLPESPYTVVVNEHRGGRVRFIDRRRLWRATEDNGWVVAVVPAIGDFVPRGSPLLRIWGREDADAGSLADLVSLSRERTFQQDVGFGLRQLVDIAVRALSPGVNDPTTAVQAIDEIHDLLRCLCGRAIPAGADRDHPRVIFNAPGWDSYVQLCLDEIRTYGSGNIQVVRRLRYLLEDLSALAPSSRQGVLAREMTLLEQAALSQFGDAEQALVQQASAQGQGPPPLRGIDRQSAGL